jgi:hypothetical protein
MPARHFFDTNASDNHCCDRDIVRYAYADDDTNFAAYLVRPSDHRCTTNDNDGRRDCD